MGYPFCVASKPGKREASEARQLGPGAEPRPDRLEPPSPAAEELIRAHLAETHGIQGFELDRHVYLGGRRGESQVVTWNPARRAFRCARCPGRVFATGEISDERVMAAQLWDQGLAPFLAGPHTTQERDKITRAYLAGDLSEAVVQAGRKLVRRRPAAPRPSVEHRRARVQEWMLQRYAVHGVLQRVIEEASRLSLEEWSLLAGRPLAPSTLRRYWQRIPDAKVAAAKRAFQAHQSRS